MVAFGCTHKFGLKTYLLSFVVVLSSVLAYGQEDTHEIIVKGVDALMEGQYKTSIELLTQARIKAEEEGDFKNLFVAINNIGLNYHKLLDLNEALEYYLESYTIAIKELDYSFEMTSLNNIAILYSKEKNLDKAIEYFQKAYDLAKPKKDRLKKGIYAINLAQAYYDQNKYDLANPLIEEAQNLLENDPDYLLEALAIKAILTNAVGKPEQAKILIDQLLPKLKENRYAETRVLLLLTLADIANNRQQLNEALILCNKALRQQPVNIETRYAIFNQINTFTRKAGFYSQSIVAMDSLIHLKQTIHDLQNDRQYQANRVKFEVLNYESELLEGNRRIAFQKKALIVSVIAATLIIMLLAWSLRLSRIKNKQRKDLLERQEKILSLELENEKATTLLLENQLKENETQLLLEQEKFRGEIESKNRKLSAKALYLTDRNRLIKNIINDLEHSDGIKPSREIKEYVRRLKGLLKSDEEWENFIEYFDEVNHGLLGRLKQKHENLNANDIRFISYLYMNLSLKEIASIMNITPEASRKRKERISKKIDLKDNEDLYSYLSLL